MEDHGERRVRQIKRANIVLIKPSKYDDDGYVIRHLKGVLPSNTLACLYGLTEDVRRRGVLGNDLKWKIQLLDETVHKIDVRKIVRASRHRDTKTVVCLVGVQTNQFPRAADLAVQFREAGLDVLLGGFHVSGTLAMFDEVTPEIRTLIDQGITIVKGEVDEAWGSIIQDALGGKLKPIYDLINDKPDLWSAPIPMTNRKYLRRFASPNFGTIDCGRGCPFNCSFCTIINVQGHKMRVRSPALLANAIRQDYHRNHVRYYFFTDDNFARNKHWEEIFDALIRLRKEGMAIEFMMQVDVLAHKRRNFASKAKAAGCTQVFIGMESTNAKNLEQAGKKQNNVDDFKKMIAAWHDAHVTAHVGYIIGLPFDTEESVMQDVHRLKTEMKVDQASFFMFTPLPGSKDHHDMVMQGAYLDGDLNKYDSFHETAIHPHLRDGAWTKVYHEAWKSFYSFENMKAILLRSYAENYWSIFKNFIWYKNAALIEREHPMIAGFFRLKNRLSRRPGYAIEGRRQHAKRRYAEIRHQLKEWIKLFWEMEELWLQTRKRGEIEVRVAAEVENLRREFGKWRDIKVSEIHEAYQRVKAKIPTAKVPSKLQLYMARLNLLSDRVTYTRQHLDHFWRETKENFLRGRLHRINVPKMVFNFIQDARLTTKFALRLMISP